MKRKCTVNLLVAALLAGAGAAPGQVTFTQITNGPIVTDPGHWAGCAWGDFHNTGFLDLVVCNYRPGTNAYYQNNGDGTFTRVLTGAPVADSDYHVYFAAGDYDNDGHLDLVETTGAFVPRVGQVTLYHNNGDGTFTTTDSGGLGGIAGHFGALVWGDFDNDGFLDVFAGDHGAADDNGTNNLLFHNNGAGTFTRITSGAEVSDISIAFAIAWQDYDGDGRPDLFVINNNEQSTFVNFLYHNEGGGVFSRVTNNIIATDSWREGAACAAWGDYDNDGLPDLFVTDEAGVRNQLYHNNGDGQFTRVATGPGQPELPGSGNDLETGNGCAWGDYDNDGYLDLFVSGWGQKNELFHNNGDGTFTKITSGSIVQGSGPVSVCGAVSWVDYDNDGFLDLFVGQDTSNYNTQAPGTNLLYHNNGNTNGWLEVKLVGTVANRSAIGAKVRAHATIGGKSFWQLREINGGCGYNSLPLVAHFGLGNATNVDTLRIEWPSGTVQECSNVAPRQILTITEPPLLLASLTNGSPQFSIRGGRGFRYEVDSSPDLLAWASNSLVAITNLNGMAQIVDPNPPSASRFYRLKQIVP